jgi:hypothetical protein
MTQEEADAFIAMEKHRADDTAHAFPSPGERIAVPLVSPDKREQFILDVRRERISIKKATYQNRVRSTVILMRLDLDGPPHRNPDGEEIPCPHLHVYKEGFGVKWAEPAPVDRYGNPTMLFETLLAFMQHCNIVEREEIVVQTQQAGLFES